jgi:hypothetical protein
VAKVRTSKAGNTISQIGCGTSMACHSKPIKEEEEEEEEVVFLKGAQFGNTVKRVKNM